MDRAPIGNSHQPRPVDFGHVARNGDLAGNLTDIAVPGLPVRTVPRMDPAMRQTYGEAVEGAQITIKASGDVVVNGEKILER